MHKNCMIGVKKISSRGFDLQWRMGPVSQKYGRRYIVNIKLPGRRRPGNTTQSPISTFWALKILVIAVE